MHDFHYSPCVHECFSDEYFSILHCNIRSLTANFDNLQTMLSNLYFPLSIVGLSEIKLNVGQDLLSNTNLSGTSSLHCQVLKRLGVWLFYKQ